MAVLKFAMALLLYASAYVCNAQSFCECGGSGYEPYRIDTIAGSDTTTVMSFDVGDLLGLLSSYGESSPNVYDLNSDQIVNSSDLLEFLTWYGATPIDGIDLCSIELFPFPNSHGWQAMFPGAYFCIVHITAFDEGGLSYAEACPLSTFYVELVYLDQTVLIYYN